jgi:GDP-mannose 6-dehydrogenase
VRIAVFGLGYVGCVSAACLAELGHDVIGVDVNQAKVSMITRGQSPVVETGLPELIAKVTRSGQFTATASPEDAVLRTEVALICVGTPSRPNQSIALDSVRRVCEQIGGALRNKANYYVVCVRSTVLPGTVTDGLIPILERASGKRAGADFGVCMVPEFLREGTSVSDFFGPPTTVIGELDTRSGDIVAELFESLPAPLMRTRIHVAEMLKYANNAFHALKVTFANEIGNICKALNCDSHAVMEIFCQDRKLNLSPYYLKPGFAFGGSCLPKDLRALTYHARTLDVDTPLLTAILESNRRHVANVVAHLLSYKGRSLGFLGLSFKHGTDDMRESPIVEVIETMIGKGFDVRIYDEYVSMARLLGTNKEYIEREIPHISSLLCSSMEEILEKSDVIVISSRAEQFLNALRKGLRTDQTVVDLVRLVDQPGTMPAQYYGICW